MCGIAGIVMKQGAIPRQPLIAASEQLQHRGPDDLGLYLEGPIGLAHRRLSIIDLSGGHQPIQDSAERFVIVVNGEVYNYIELRHAHEKKGRVYKTASDSETILHGWALDGIEGIKRLHGMYAFALYDRFHKELILGRDRIGIKPLFYTKLNDRVVFASEIKALLPLLSGSPAINPDALAQFLQNQFHSGEETIFAGIKRVPPGSCLCVDADLNIRTQTYWSPLGFQSRRVDFEEAQEEFEPLLLRVMEEHMRSDVPFGLFLSGGVDSAVLLAMLTEKMVHPIHTYSVGFSGSQMTDELEPATWIAGRFKTVHTPIVLTKEQIFGRMVHTIWAADDLMRDYASLPTSLLSERAAQELKVVFSGEGGDEVFAGYRRYRPNLETWLKSILWPGTGGFRVRGGWKAIHARKTFNPVLRKASESVREPFLAAWRSCPAAWSKVQKFQYIDFFTSLPDNLLVKLDRMGMGFGLEGRVPFLDHRIVEFGFSLPDSLKINGNHGKWFLKRWAATRLPPEHLNKPKRGFHVPVGEWLKGQFLTQLGGKLMANKAIGEWFNLEGVRYLIDTQSRRGNASREVWCLLEFAIWHKLFVESPVSRPQPDENPLDWI